MGIISYADLAPGQVKVVTVAPIHRSADLCCFFSTSGTREGKGCFHCAGVCWNFLAGSRNSKLQIKVWKLLKCLYHACCQNMQSRFLDIQPSADLRFRCLLLVLCHSLSQDHKKGDLGVNLMLYFFGSLLTGPSPRIKSSGAAKMRSS